MTAPSFSRSYVTGTSAIVVGIFVMIAALLVRDTTLGWPTALVDRWYFAVGAVALMVFGVCARKDAATFGVLAFFLIVGGAAQLYVTDPGAFPALHLEPKSWKEWALVGVIAAEALAALIVIGRAGAGEVLTEAQRRLGFGKIAILVVMTGFLVVPVTGFLARGAGAVYLAHVAVGVLLTLVHLTVLAAMSLVTSPISGLYRLTPLAPAAVTFFVSLILCFMAFEAIPHSEGEVAFQFQARLFAGGALSAPLPPEAAQPGLAYDFLAAADGRWYAAVAPGWPAVLALGELIGMPWLINPLLAALSVLMAHAIAARLAGRDEADMVAMMMGASPWLLAMAASLLPHTLTMTLMLFGWWWTLRALDSRRGMAQRLVVAGAALGLMFAVRPVEAGPIAALTLLWLFFSREGAPGRALLAAVGVGVGAIPALAYNWAMTGSALLSPSRAYTDGLWGAGADRFGFGAGVGQPGGGGELDVWPGHSAGEGFVNVLNLLSSLEFEMMGWPVGSLAFLICFLLWQRPDRRDLAMMAVAALFLGAAFLYWDADAYYVGPRALFLAAFPLIYLSARGYQTIRARFPDKDELAFVRIDSLFWYACVFGFCVFLPWRAVTKYYEFAQFHPTVIEDAADGRFKDKVVLVQPNGSHGSTLMLNDPWLRGTVYLVDTGTLDMAALAAAFPGREVVRYANDWTGR
jgi:hypothetical protein